MKRLLVVGASILQLPAIKKAKEMGIWVGTVDYNPQAIGGSYADEFREVSTIDEKGVCNAAKEFGIDGIITLATDMPIRSVAYTAERLGLNGITYETAIKATDKGEMIKAFQAADVEHPWYIILQSSAQLSDAEQKIKFPCISKPLDSAGSRGVVLIKSKDELEGAVHYSSRNGRKGGVIIEEYLQGREVSVEAIVINNNVYIIQVTDKLTNGAPSFVEMGHSQPSSLSKTDVREIKKLAIRAIKSIGINMGPVHVEIMLTEKGPRMIELGARMGGDCIATHLLPLSTGVDMVKATIELALGELPDITPRFDKGAAVRYLDVEPGCIKSISGIRDAQQIDGVQEVVITKGEGDIVREINSSNDRIGFVIAQGINAEAAISCCQDALNRITVNYGITDRKSPC